MAREIYAFGFLLILIVKNSKSAPTKSIIDRINKFPSIVSKNAIKRDSALNVYRQWEIYFEDRVVLEGLKTASLKTLL